MSVDSSGSNPKTGLSQLLNLSVPADFESVGAVSDAIAANLDRLQVPEQKRMEIALAVQEALVNAVVHGCGGDRSKNVSCRMEGDSTGRILIIVSDPGPGFNPETVADPKGAESLYHDHGRGVYLIRQLMDDVQFEHGGRQIRMWKY
jgi:serine/threonine-protein kinase RsbW